jgi:signal transduction histidine kinase
MRRLYLQIYLTIIVILVIFALAVGAVWRLATDDSQFEDTLQFVTEIATRTIPPPGTPRFQIQRTLNQLHHRLRADFALYGPRGGLIAQAGRPLPPVNVRHEAPGRLQRLGRAPVWLLPLNDGRHLVIRLAPIRWQPGFWLIVSLGAIGVAVAIGALPLTRRLTRRLERLKAGVDQLGQGDLATRVKVEGKDEVAALAESFNQSASHIETLVRANKMLLANSSHELRTPLTRISMALALLGDKIEPDKRAQIGADIAELDQLIEEILLASRLDTKQSQQFEDIDLLALAAEEAARDNISVEGAPVTVRGDRALLRRMIRNLIVNARRHAGDDQPDIRVAPSDAGRAVLEIRDRGPGIPDAERDRVFEPFYRLAGSSETGRGSGLGLALVRQIARNHDGDVVCQAAEGGGTVFRVSLPAATPTHA